MQLEGKDKVADWEVKWERKSERKETYLFTGAAATAEMSTRRKMNLILVSNEGECGFDERKAG